VTSRRQLLGAISGGRVLDVATGGGAFAAVLAAELRDYTEIVGIDIDREYAEGFRAALDTTRHAGFLEMDATALTFADASFETVAISDSLHHFSDPALVLREMWRVLAPGGAVILSEMYRDGMSAAQQTHVELHHLAAAVDQRRGTVHRETYARKELLALAMTLPLADVGVCDHREPQADPRAPHLVEQVSEIIDRVVARSGNDPAIHERADAVRRRLADVGFDAATTLVVVGRK
jgi:2-polyprenyl-3-methyl-5-hydroxy-6-metoxy-1,4-benzoquinol methylase